MNAEAGKCKCGCGAIPERGDYIPGHDVKHRSQPVDRAGGVDKLAGLINQVDAYMLGEIERVSWQKEFDGSEQDNHEVSPASGLLEEALYAKGYNQRANCRPRIWGYQDRAAKRPVLLS